MNRVVRERVVRIRRMVEYYQRLTEQAQQRLAERQRAVTDAEASLRAVESSRRALTGELELLVSGGAADLAALELGERCQQWLAQQATEQARALAEARQQEDEARAALLAQERERRKLEKMAERWCVEWEREARRVEHRLLDDIAVSRFARGERS